MSSEILANLNHLFYSISTYPNNFFFYISILINDIPSALLFTSFNDAMLPMIGQDEMCEIMIDNIKIINTYHRS